MSEKIRFEVQEIDIKHAIVQMIKAHYKNDPRGEASVGQISFDMSIEKNDRTGEIYPRLEGAEVNIWFPAN